MVRVMLTGHSKLLRKILKNGNDGGKVSAKYYLADKNLNG